MSKRKAERLDRDIEDMILADSVRASLGPPGSKKSFLLFECPWTMLPDPWRIEWYDEIIEGTCWAYPVGQPMSGIKYCMFAVLDENKDVVNYIYLQDQYHLRDPEEEE